MISIPNLYLKWRVFRSLIGDTRSDADIARTIFDDEEGPIKFSKLLYGDYGCRPEIGAELVDVINRCIGAHRNAHGLAPVPAKAMTTGDLPRSVYEFTRKLIEAAEIVDPGRLEEAHQHLFAELAPTAIVMGSGPRLRIERYQLDRAFSTMGPSGGEGPIVFEPERHSGQFTVEGVDRDPVAVYAMVARDSESAGHLLWEHAWGDTVLWLPSPFCPARKGNTLSLMPTPQPVLPIPGRFVATAVLVFDRKAVADLDPRGANPPPALLDEQQTARFLTNMRRMAKRKASPIAVTSGEYHVASVGRAAAAADD